jgi:SAM-dependent methyltransferase
MEPYQALMDLGVPKSPYQLETSFDRRALQLPDGRRKAQLFAAFIPAGCRTVLDAGGGTGWATIGIREKCNVVTLDNCAESLSHAPGATIMANVEALPCADRSFDLVMSSQVLEHLPSDALDTACSEMMRVAKNYLMVSVPYREALEVRFVRCGFCQHVFHPYYHCRSFTEEDLAELFPQWLMAEWHVFGALCRGSGVTALRRLPRVGSTRNLTLATEDTICPECGKQGGDNLVDQSTTRGSIFHRILSFSKRRLRRCFAFHEIEPYPTFLPQALGPYWIAALFIREGASQVDGDLANLSEGRLSSGDR